MGAYYDDLDWENELETDPELESLSDYGSMGYPDDLLSITSTMNKYDYLQGRRYHSYYGETRNILPIDSIESDRLDLHHDTFLLLMNGKLHLAPLNNPGKILDIGTGTGIWAIDMADKYPSAEIIGTDLSPVMLMWTPTNCKFEIEDAIEEWNYEDNSFDYIHIRNIAQAIPDWDFLVAEAYRCLKPGGYIELAEISNLVCCDDGTMTENNGVKVYSEHLQRAMTRLGRQHSFTAQNLKDALLKPRFVNLVTASYKQVLAPWPKDERMKAIGHMMLINGETGYHAYGLKVFMSVLGMSAQQAHRVCDEARIAALTRGQHTYNPFHVAYAQKPVIDAENPDTETE